jgi:ACS family pantothenate transporter-like MFS transporter
VIAIAIAIYGVIVFPDTPKTTKAFYLTAEDRELAKSRISPRPKAKFDKAAVKNIFFGWRYWMFSLLFVFTSQLEACVSHFFY